MRVVKFKKKNGKDWFKAILIGFVGEMYLVEFCGREMIIDPDDAILS